MPRTNRIISYTHIYHIMLRGINKQNIFNDDFDKIKFLKILKETKDKYQYKIYAYCLMNNHVHLLICDYNKMISSIIQSLAIRYSLYFNKKYERVGHLFQNRYKSKCVENERYLLNLVRYIHQNPENANVGFTENYRWSSFKEYITHNKLIDSDYILNFFEFSIEKFKNFNLNYIENYKDELEYEFINKFDDNKIKQIIEKELHIRDVNEIANYNIKLRNNYIKCIKKMEGVTCAQIARILNISRKIVERA